MGLINCPECGSQVSDKAASCPKCGHPIAVPVQHKESVMKQFMNVSWMAILIGLAIFGVFALISTCKWQPL